MIDWLVKKRWTTSPSRLPREPPNPSSRRPLIHFRVVCSRKERRFSSSRHRLAGVVLWRLHRPACNLSPNLLISLQPLAIEHTNALPTPTTLISLQVHDNERPWVGNQQIWATESGKRNGYPRHSSRLPDPNSKHPNPLLRSQHSRSISDCSSFYRHVCVLSRCDDASEEGRSICSNICVSKSTLQ